MAANEMLDVYVFESLREAREITRQWITVYNEERPLDSFGKPTSCHVQTAGRTGQTLYFRTVSLTGKLTVLISLSRFENLGITTSCTCRTPVGVPLGK